MFAKAVTVAMTTLLPSWRIPRARSVPATDNGRGRNRPSLRTSRVHATQPCLNPGHGRGRIAGLCTISNITRNLGVLAPLPSTVSGRSLHHSCAVKQFLVRRKLPVPCSMRHQDDRWRAVQSPKRPGLNMG
jgi:hypothetical protein